MDEQTIHAMFDLIHANMYALMPTGNTKEQDYALWRQALDEGLRDGIRHILYYRDGDLRGYISYLVAEADSTIYLCELQICPQSRGNGTTFRILLAQFLGEIKDRAVDTIRTYANHRNPVSQRLIEKLGFEPLERTHGGMRYAVSKEAFMRRLCRIMSHRQGISPGRELVSFP